MSKKPTEVAIAAEPAIVIAAPPVPEAPASSIPEPCNSPLSDTTSPVSGTIDFFDADESRRRPTIKHQEAISDNTETLHRPKLETQRRQSSHYSQMTMDYFGKIPASYNALASAFTWILLAGFVIGPSAQQAAQKAGAGEIYQKVVTKVPMLAISLACSGIGALGMIGLWIRWRSNYLWLVHKIFLPGFLNGLAGTVAAAVNIWAIQGGNFHFNAPAIITISVTGDSTVICFALTLVYQLFVLSVRREHVQEMGDEESSDGPGLLGTVAEFNPGQAKNSILAPLSMYGN